jgi:N-acetylglucosamine-6-phosphate deacetylase
VNSKIIHSVSVFQEGKLIENAWVQLAEYTTIGFGDAWQKLQADEVVDGTNHVLHAGFFDSHCHGGNGFAANNSAQDILGILDFNYQNQVSRSIVSLVSAPVTQMVRIAKECEGLLEDPRFIGLHFEGPFLSHEHRGAQDPDAVKIATDQEIQAIAECKTIRSITVAPECLSEAQAAVLEASGIKLCFGHSSAGYEETLEFLQKHPESVMTHTFNGMRGIHHRAPGPVPAAIETDTYMELIADGIHVEPAAARLIPAERLILVTDAIQATGQPDGKYSLGEVKIEVRDGVARTESGSLAGSTLKITQAVRNYAWWTNNLELALRAAITNPEKAYKVQTQSITFENNFLLSLNPR